MLGLSVAELFIHFQLLTTLKKVFLFSFFTMPQLDSIVQHITQMKVRAGEFVYSEGKESQGCIFILVSGRIGLYRGQDCKTKKRGVDIFGESGVLNPTQICSESALVLSASAEVWAIPRSPFLSTLGVPDGKIGPDAVHPVFRHLRERCNLRLDGYDMSYDQFEPQKFIGRGGFGIVLLTKHRPTGAEYAMKVIPKADLNEDDFRTVSREKSILQEMNHPFVVQLITAFVDHSRFYILSELITGGDLLDALGDLEEMNRTVSSFYVGSILLAVEYVHSHNILFRDLKPENVMLGSDGYIKLIDFGHAKQLASRSDMTYTLAGTPHYIAPEVLRGKGYSYSADCWAIGCVMYEMLYGNLPFVGAEDDPTDQYALFSRILVASPAVPLGRESDVDAWELCSGLLRKKVEKRLSLEEVRLSHPFFDGFSFMELANKNVDPPLTFQRPRFQEVREFTEPFKIDGPPPIYWDDDAF
jgi:cGMP-dependent protein kinase